MIAVHNRIRLLRLLSPILLFAATPALAQPLSVGDHWPTLELTDQHDAPAAIGDDVQLILFSRDMTGAGIIKDVLADDGLATLTKAKAVVLSDISRMPSLITRLFALPAMRRRPYAMILDRDGQATAGVPSLESHVTVIRLDHATVLSISKVDTGDKLRAAIAEVTTAQPEATQP